MRPFPAQFGPGPCSPGPAVSPLAATVIHRLTAFCLWLSLPLSIWLISGWIGLVLHWQAELGPVCLLARALPKPQNPTQVL